jgi:hypothetical protein
MTPYPAHLLIETDSIQTKVNNKLTYLPADVYLK